MNSLPFRGVFWVVGGDLKAQFLPLALQEVSGSAASLEVTEISAGRQQSQAISISAAVPRLEYKAEDARGRKRADTEKDFSSRKAVKSFSPV